eukprot:gene2327-8621_t
MSLQVIDLQVMSLLLQMSQGLQVMILQVMSLLLQRIQSSGTTGTPKPPSVDTARTQETPSDDPPLAEELDAHGQPSPSRPPWDPSFGGFDNVRQPFVPFAPPSPPHPPGPPFTPQQPSPKKPKTPKKPPKPRRPRLPQKPNPPNQPLFPWYPYYPYPPEIPFPNSPPPDYCETASVGLLILNDWPGAPPVRVDTWATRRRSSSPSPNPLLSRPPRAESLHAALPSALLLHGYCVSPVALVSHSFCLLGLPGVYFAPPSPPFCAS